MDAAMMKKNVALVLVGVALGVGAGVFATGWVRAQSAPAPGGRWELDCSEAHGFDETRAIVRDRGASGWELVAMENSIVCFKRAVPPPPRSEPYPGY